MSNSQSQRPIATRHRATYPMISLLHDLAAAQGQLDSVRLRLKTVLEKNQNPEKTTSDLLTMYDEMPSSAPPRVPLTQQEDFLEELFGSLDTGSDTVSLEPLGDSLSLDTPIQNNRVSAKKTFIMDTTQTWLAQNKGKVSIMWKPVTFEGESFILLSTWRLRSPGWLWNITGVTGNNLIHSCGPDVLVQENGDSLKCSVDIDTTVEITVPKSAFCGRKIHVEGTLFVWALQPVKGREVRLWINEATTNPARKCDIWKHTITMPATRVS